MARTVTYVPRKDVPSSTAVLALTDVPAEVVQEVEDIYEALTKNPNGRMRAEFETAAELTEYVTQVTSYCALRPAGAIRFRKSPTKGLADNVMDFRITDLQTKNEKITADIREATEAANAATSVATTVPAPAAGKKSGRR